MTSLDRALFRYLWERRGRSDAVESAGRFPSEPTISNDTEDCDFLVAWTRGVKAMYPLSQWTRGGDAE